MKKHFKISKTIKKSVSWIAKTYYEYSASCKYFEKKSNKQNPEEQFLYFMNRKYRDAIKDTFYNTISSDYQEKAWKYFFDGKKVSFYDEKLIKDEIDVWLYYLAKELGLLTTV